MDPNRQNDTMTLALVAILVAPILFATGLASCDARDARRAEAALVAEAKAKAAAAAVASARVADETQREQLRQGLMLATLEQRAAVQRESFEDYKDLTIYGLTIVGGLVALVGILFPVGLYLISIRPGEKVVAEARRAVDTLDKRFAELTEVHRQQETDEAILRLRSDEDFERDRGLEHLLFRARGLLTDRQVADIVAAARASTDEELRFRLTTIILGDYRSSHLFELLTERMTSPRANMYLDTALRNCELPGSLALRQSVQDHGIRRSDGQGLSAVLHGARREAEGFFRDLINDWQWLGKFSPLQKAIVLNSLFTTAPDLTQMLEGSELYASVKGRLAFFFADSARKVEARPEDAVIVQFYKDGRVDGAYPAHLNEFTQARDEAVAARDQAKA